MRTAAVLICLPLLLLGCDGKAHVSALPTVQATAEVSPFVTCHDWNGVRPDKEVQVARTEKRPDYCYVGDVCFFNCPEGH